MDELWKEIPSFEGKYSISNLGRVRAEKSGRILKLTIDKKGYLYITFSQKETKPKFKVHRLVALAFIPNPHNYPQIDHINRIKTDNTLKNLRWVTNSMNGHNTKDREGGSSSFKGVSFDKSAKSKKWKASVSINGKLHHLGRFLCEKEASKAVINFKIKNQLI